MYTPNKLLFNRNNNFSNNFAHSSPSNDYIKIYNNKLLKQYPSLTPIYPLYKNYFPIISNSINIEPFKKEILEYKNIWNCKDNYSFAWKSITLKSKDGMDQDFLETIDFSSSPSFKYTKISENFPNIVNFLNSFKNNIYLVRLLKLDAGGKIKYHTDEIAFKNSNNLIRCHLPIITHPSVLFKIGLPLNAPSPGTSIWNAETIYEKHLDPSYLWYTNVNALHSVENNSPIDRIHLVFDMTPPTSFLHNLKTIS